MALIIICTLLASVLLTARAQTTQLTCAQGANAAPSPTFNINLLTKSQPWFVRLLQPIGQEGLATCELARFTWSNGQLNITQQLIIGGQLIEMTAVGFPAPDGRQGSFMVGVDASQASANQQPFIVLLVDVDLYVGWACYQLPNQPNVFYPGIWVSTPDGNITDQQIQRAQATLTQNGIAPSNLLTMQSNPTSCAAFL